MTDTSDPWDDEQLRGRLRAADPAASLPPAEPARTARLLEETMTNDVLPGVAQASVRSRSPLTWLAAAAAAVLIAGVGIFATLGLDDDASEPPMAGPVTVTELEATPLAGRCMVPDAQALVRSAEVAADATVVSLADGRATLEVDRWYAGKQTDQISVAAPSRDLQALLLAVDFQQGKRYLVAGDANGQLMVCGFSGPYSADLAALYDEAFGG